MMEEKIEGGHTEGAGPQKNGTQENKNLTDIRIRKSELLDFLKEIGVDVEDYGSQLEISGYAKAGCAYVDASDVFLIEYMPVGGA